MAEKAHLILTGSNMWGPKLKNGTMTVKLAVEMRCLGAERLDTGWDRGASDWKKNGNIKN